MKMVVNDKCITLLNEIDICLNKSNLIISERINSTEIRKYPDSFFVYIIIRLLTNVDSSNNLLKKSNQNIYHLLSIGVIIRSGILDCLQLLYLLDFIDPNIHDFAEQKKLIKEIKKINCNQIYYVLNDLKFITNNSEQKLTQQHFDFFNSCPECFINGKADFDIKNRIEDYKNGLSAKELISKTNFNFKENAMNLFECYSIYSKYEHYGEFTQKIYENTHTKTDDEVSRIIFCYNQFFKSINVFSTFLFDNNIELLKKQEQLTQLLSDIIDKTTVYLQKNLPQKPNK